MTDSLEWKSYKDFIGYRVNRYGRIQSLWIKKSLGYKKGFKTELGDEWKEMCPSKNDEGYYQIRFINGNKKRSIKLHILILELFGPNKPNNKMYALHKNDDKNNNSLDNLYWGSRRDNEIDKITNGIDRHTKLKIDDINSIRKRYNDGESQYSIAETLNVNQSSISRIITKLRWAFVEDTSNGII